LVAQGLRVAGRRLGREVVVVPAVGAPAVHLPRQQAPPRLERPQIPRRLAAPRGDERLVAVLRLVVQGQAVVCGGPLTAGAPRSSSSSSTRLPAGCFHLLVWHLTQLRSRMGFTSR